MQVVLHASVGDHRQQVPGWDGPNPESGTASSCPFGSAMTSPLRDRLAALGEIIVNELGHSIELMGVERLDAMLEGFAYFLLGHAGLCVAPNLGARALGRIDLLPAFREPPW
ncbi:hypothetical protein ACFV3E_41680 [Streptomyces sp. NPDC059718]